MVMGSLRMKMLLAALAAAALIAAGCSKGSGEPVPSSGNEGQATVKPAVNQEENGEQQSKPEPETIREVKTYLDKTFNDVADGEEIADAAHEGAGFKAVQIDGTGWAVSANPQDWAAMFVGVSGEDGTEIFLENFAVETSFFLPENSQGIANDGGIPLFVSAEGRYDAALQYAPDGSGWLNLWKAGNVDGGPILSNDQSNYPDRGAVSDFSLEPGKEYVLTIIGTYRKDEDENEYVYLRFYIDDKLVVEDEVPFWKGGFGLRGWQSDIHYRYLKVSDPPLTAPDGQAVVLN